MYSEDSKTMKDYDDAIAFLGHWGRFQRLIFFLLCICIVPNGFVFSVVFLTAIPKHHCMVPDVNLTQEWSNATIPIEVINSLMHEQSIPESRFVCAFISL